MFFEQVGVAKVCGVVHVCEQHAVYDVRQNISGWGWVCDTCDICGALVNGKYFDIELEYAEREKRHARISEKFLGYEVPQDGSMLVYKSFYSENAPNKVWERIKGWFK